MTNASAGWVAGPIPVKERLTSLDAFRGFDILTMVFVNYYIAGMAAIPFILRHATGLMGTLVHADIGRILWPYYGTGGSPACSMPPS